MHRLRWPGPFGSVPEMTDVKHAMYVLDVLDVLGCASFS
jgi:hypothetical protein